MANYYCQYCGQKFNSIQALTNANCPKHPAGFAKGKHTLYEGSEKSQYFCKFCGQSFSSIQALTNARCPKHPDGFGKSNHVPAL